MSKSTAVIVGGSSGIGLATARRLAMLDTTVHIVGRNQSRLDDATEHNPALIAHRADAGRREEIGAVFDQIGPVDWMVITLSGSEGAGPIVQLDLSVLRRAFDAKLWGHLTTIQAGLPYLSPTGSITLLGAITARTGMAGTAGIAAVNGAVEALIKPLAVELAPVRVNGVSPGFVDTPWWDGLPENVRADYFAHAARTLPGRHIASADEVAEAVLLAATNPNLTGTVIETDAGARLVSMS